MPAAIGWTAKYDVMTVGVVNADTQPQRLKSSIGQQQCESLYSLHEELGHNVLVHEHGCNHDTIAEREPACPMHFGQCGPIVWFG
mgnify:CR=1 FL=1